MLFAQVIFLIFHQKMNKKHISLPYNNINPVYVLYELPRLIKNYSPVQPSEIQIKLVFSYFTNWDRCFRLLLRDGSSLKCKLCISKGKTPEKYKYIS